MNLMDGVKPFDGVLADPLLGGAAACQNITGTLLDPAMYALAEPCGPVEAKIGLALSQAPTGLLLAHLTLREAVREAQDLLAEVRSTHARGAPAVPAARAQYA